MRSALLDQSSGCLALLALVSLTALSSACTHGTATDGSGTGSAPAPEDPSVPLATSRAKGIVIATLQTHDKRVAILGRMIEVANGSTDPQSLRVIVHTNEGALVADGLTIAELQRLDPMLYTLVTSALASNDGTYIDATLHDAHREVPGNRDFVRTTASAGGASGPRLLDPSR
jgi:hypothetical protein